MLIHCVFPKLLDPIRKKFQTPELQKLTKLAYPEPKKESMYAKHRELDDPSLEGIFSKKLRKKITGVEIVFPAKMLGLRESSSSVKLVQVGVGMEGWRGGGGNQSNQ